MAAVVAALTAGLVFGAPSTGLAADKIFVSIPGIEGESTAAGHVNEIVAASAGQSVALATAETPSGNRVTLSEVSIVKKIDKASPRLFFHVAKGTLFAAVTVYFVRPDGQEYYRITLNNVLISSVQTTATPEAASELVRLLFTKIEWRYTVFSANGQPQGVVTQSYDPEADQRN